MPTVPPPESPKTRERPRDLNAVDKRAETDRARPWWAILGFGFVIALCLWLAVSPDVAAKSSRTCRTYKGQEVCIDRIKRSAQRYWEYRVKLTIDGERQAPDRLDCRNGQRVDGEGFIEPFAKDDVGWFVCQFFNRRAQRDDPDSKQVRRLVELPTDPKTM